MTCGKKRLHLGRFGTNCMGVRSEFWRNKRVLITGHTGFKGSWLSQWLLSMGAHVCGVGLTPRTERSLFELLKLAPSIQHHLLDIRNLTALQGCFQNFQPEVVFHLAAQPLVLESYQDPVGTMTTNVMGTTNLLECIRDCPTVKTAVIVTTDKVYEPDASGKTHCENDALGGHDPYSASKACCELLVSSYRRSFFETRETLLATARAGNVIGGGDFSVGRLLPDTFQAWAKNKPVVIRQPKAVRPWQHVLDALHGYLMLAEALVEQGEPFAKAWNFGPEADDMWSVNQILAELEKLWHGGPSFKIEPTQYHENPSLLLSSELAQSELNWRPKWNLKQALKQSSLWYEAWSKGEAMQSLTLQQIELYMAQ